MRKYFHIAAIIFLSFGNTNAQTGWKRITAPDGANPAHFWSADSGTAGLSFTTNGGISWGKLTLPDAFENTVDSITTGLRWDDVFAQSTMSYLVLGTSY